MRVTSLTSTCHCICMNIRHHTTLWFQFVLNGVLYSSQISHCFVSMKMSPVQAHMFESLAHSYCWIRIRAHALVGNISLGMVNLEFSKACSRPSVSLICLPTDHDVKLLATILDPCLPHHSHDDHRIILCNISQPLGHDASHQ